MRKCCSIHILDLTDTQSLPYFTIAAFFQLPDIRIAFISVQLNNIQTCLLGNFSYDGRLFIHKNTVQYKIKKIAEATGYDPRKLSDAVLLYLCVRLRKA